LTHDDVTGWTDYVNMASHRQSRGSTSSYDSEEKVLTGRGIFPQPYTIKPTCGRVNCHDDADSETTGSDDGFLGLQSSP